MTVYNFQSVAVYAELGGALRLARGARAFTTDPTTGAPVDATQGTRVAPYVDADAAGDVTFTAESWPVRLTSGATYEDVWPTNAAGPDDATVAGLVGAATATQTALDARYISGAATLPITKGGTGATTAPTALVALGGAPLSLTGTYAARPAANTVPAGTIYYPTNIPEMYRSNGTAWTVVGSGGNELGYAQSVTSFANATTTATDVTGLTTTFVVGERPIAVRFEGDFTHSVAGGNTVIYIVLDGITISQPNGRAVTAGGWTTISRMGRASGLTPGSTHTAKIRTAAIGGTGTVTGGSINPMFIQVVTL